MNKFNNPFPLSDDNKRYHTWNYYLKQRFQKKVFKVALNAAFSCPNRDGTCGVGGCTFCSSLGSGDCAGDIHDDLAKQFEDGLAVMRNKWPQGVAMAYFQAYTNTYAPLATLKKTFDPFLAREDVIALAIATRADCLTDDIIAYLDEASQHKEIWIELGLQSIHDETAKQINRGHDFACFKETVEQLAKTNCKICVHLMNSLPNETKEMMIESAKVVGQMPIHALKIHMLHLLKNTTMGNEYLHQPFPLLSKDAYIDIIVEQLKVLPPHIIIQRLTGDGVAEDLIEPQWTRKKVVVLNDIDKELLRQDTMQGANL